MIPPSRCWPRDHERLLPAVRCHPGLTDAGHGPRVSRSASATLPDSADHDESVGNAAGQSEKREVLGTRQRGQHEDGGAHGQPARQCPQGSTHVGAGQRHWSSYCGQGHEEPAKATSTVTAILCQLGGGKMTQPPGDEGEGNHEGGYAFVDRRQLWFRPGPSGRLRAVDRAIAQQRLPARDSCHRVKRTPSRFLDGGAQRQPLRLRLRPGLRRTHCAPACEPREPGPNEQHPGSARNLHAQVPFRLVAARPGMAPASCVSPSRVNGCVSWASGFMVVEG